MSAGDRVPSVVRVPRSVLTGRRSLLDAIMRGFGVPYATAFEVVGHFAFKNDERVFARTLAERRPNHWIFRAHQGRFCGDFVVVDMASPVVARRPVMVIDLKQGGALCEGGGGAGVQFRNAPRAVAELAASGAVAPGAAFRLISGAKDAVLAALGALPP